MPAPARASLLPAAAAVSLLVVLLGAAGLFTLHYTNVRANAALDRQTRLDAARTTALQTRVNFKTQVQEWKNILLRGTRPADFDHYLAGFEQSDAEVQAGLASVKNQLAALGLEDNGIDTLASVHRALGADYRAALATWKRDDLAGAFAVDAAVRGRDRQLGEDIDTLALTVADISARELRAAGDASVALYATLRKVVLIIGTLAVIAALGLVFAANRTTRS